MKNIKTIENKLDGMDVEMNYKIVKDPTDYTVASATVVEKEDQGIIKRFVQIIMYDKISERAIEKEVLIEKV